MITDKISASLSINELRNLLEKTYGDVKSDGKESLTLNYSGTKVVISKKKKGYDVSANVPFLFFWLIAVIIFIVQIVLKNPIGETTDYLIGQITGYIVISLVFAVIIYWVLAEIYVATKKRTIRDFCDSLDLSDSQDN